MEKHYGTVTVGAGTTGQREIGIIDFIQTSFKDNRLITISTLADEQGYLLSIENPHSSGRNPAQNIWLSKESFVGLLSSSFIFWNCKNENLEELMKETVDKNMFDYKASDNLKPFNENNTK